MELSLIPWTTHLFETKRRRDRERESEREQSQEEHGYEDTEAG